MLHDVVPEQIPLSERVAAAQEFVYGPVIDWARRSPFHTSVLGHSVHPLLTDLTLGAGSVHPSSTQPEESRHVTVPLLVGAGLAAAGPTAIAGTADWAEMTGAERRIGAVHALGTDLAVFLLLGSLIARLRGSYAGGRRLGLVGNAILAGAGFLGGHLALSRGTARRSTSAA